MPTFTIICYLYFKGKKFQFQWTLQLHPWQAYPEPFSTPQGVFSLEHRANRISLKEVTPAPLLRLPECQLPIMPGWGCLVSLFALTSTKHIRKIYSTFPFRGGGLNLVYFLSGVRRLNHLAIAAENIVKEDVLEKWVSPEILHLLLPTLGTEKGN